MFGVALDDQGIFRANFKYPIFIAFIFLLLGLVSVFMYLLITTLSTNDYSWDLKLIGQVSIMSSTIFFVPSAPFTIVWMLVKIGDHKMIADCKVPASKICMVFLYNLVSFAGVALECKYYMLNITLVQDIITVLFLLVAFLLFGICFLLVIIVPTSIQNSYENILNIYILEIKDFAYALDIFERGKQSLQAFSVMYFPTILPIIIIVIFLVITSDNFQVIGPLLICLAICFLVTYFTLEMEKIYDLIKKIVTKGRHDAFEKSSSLRDLLKMQVSVDELEASGPLTGYGFFTIEKSTLVALLSYVLTYLIILMQMHSALPYRLLKMFFFLCENMIY